MSLNPDDAHVESWIPRSCSLWKRWMMFSLSPLTIGATRQFLSTNVCGRMWTVLSSRCVASPCDAAVRKTSWRKRDTLPPSHVGFCCCVTWDSFQKCSIDVSSQEIGPYQQFICSAHHTSPRYYYRNDNVTLERERQRIPTSETTVRVAVLGNNSAPSGKSDWREEAGKSGLHFKEYHIALASQDTSRIKSSLELLWSQQMIFVLLLPQWLQPCNLLTDDITDINSL